MQVTLLRLKLIYIICKGLVHISQIIKCSSNRKTNQLMLDGEIITLYCRNCTEHNRCTVWAKRRIPEGILDGIIYITNKF